MLRRTVIAVACISGLAPIHASSARCFHYMPAEVTVTGTLFLQTDLGGPSGYGEDPANDSHKQHVYVRLDQPLCVVANKKTDFIDSQTEINLSVLQLAVSAKKKKMDLHGTIGRQLFPRGSLLHAFDGLHQARVLIMITEFKRLPM